MSNRGNRPYLNILEFVVVVVVVVVDDDDDDDDVDDDDDDECFERAVQVVQDYVADGQSPLQSMHNHTHEIQSCVCGYSVGLWFDLMGGR